MSEAFSTASIDFLRAAWVAPEPAWPGAGPMSAGLAAVERVVARALAAIRDCARIAWWDGSCIGLYLHGYVGLFELREPEPAVRDGDPA